MKQIHSAVTTVMQAQAPYRTRLQWCTARFIVVQLTLVCYLPELNIGRAFIPAAHYKAVTCMLGRVVARTKLHLSCKFLSLFRLAVSLL